MMNRIFVVILLLSALLLVFTPSGNVTADPSQSRQSALEACYSRCPCNRNGIIDWACSSCKTRCEWYSWKQMKEEAAKKGNR